MATLVNDWRDAKKRCFEDAAIFVFVFPQSSVYVIYFYFSENNLLARLCDVFCTAKVQSKSFYPTIKTG